MIERTLVLVKPDGVKRGLIGDIVKRFEQRGLKIIGAKMVLAHADLSKKHYSAHVSKPFYPSLESYITSGPVFAMVIEGVEAVANVRKLVGATSAHEALPGTIRGDFAHTSLAHTNELNKHANNIIHASGNKEEAKQEVSIWFSETEIFNYKRIDEELLQ